MTGRFFSILALVLFLLIPVQAGYAQTGGPTPGVAVRTQSEAAQADPSNDPSAWKRILDSTSQALSRQGVTDAELDGLFDETGRIREAANSEAQGLQD
ncbi:MAG: hypothetical protein ACR2O3_16920, partial [Rhizobiaceae bacterium]